MINQNKINFDWKEIKFLLHKSDILTFILIIFSNYFLKKSQNCPSKGLNVAGMIGKIVDLPQYDEISLQQAVATVGPISVGEL